MEMDLYFIRANKREKNLCGDVDHQTKTTIQIKLFTNKKNHLMHRSCCQHFRMPLISFKYGG